MPIIMPVLFAAVVRMIVALCRRNQHQPNGVDPSFRPVRWRLEPESFRRPLVDESITLAMRQKLHRQENSDE